MGNNYFIRYPNDLKYSESIFVSVLKKFIEEYNSTLIKKLKEDKSEINSSLNTFIDQGSVQNICAVNLRATNCVKRDLFSYFREFIFPRIREDFILSSLERRYSIPFNPNKTTLVHLRLEDICHRSEYDGRVSHDYFNRKIENCVELSGSEEECNYYRSLGFSGLVELLNCQSPIGEEKIEKVLSILKVKYPENEIILIASPIGEIHMKYRTLRSDNPELDMFYLTQASVIVLSRSNFAMCGGVYFNVSSNNSVREIWSPKWGHISSLGVDSTFSKTIINYY